MISIFFLRDVLKNKFGVNPPITSFRLNNMLTGAHYPIEKIECLLGQLPYTMKEGINQTLEWMRKENLIKNNSRS